MGNHSIDSINYVTIYHQTLEEVPRTLVTEKNEVQEDSKILKKLQIFFKMAIKILKNIPLHLEASQ